MDEQKKRRYFRAYCTIAKLHNRPLLVSCKLQLATTTVTIRHFRLFFPLLSVLSKWKTTIWAEFSFYLSVNLYDYILQNIFPNVFDWFKLSFSWLFSFILISFRGSASLFFLARMVLCVAVVDVSSGFSWTTFLKGMKREKVQKVDGRPR